MVNIKGWKEGNKDWETPNDLFDTLNKEFKFTLDVCATEKNTKCKKYFTIETDGLKQSWNNNIVFMNPPYGRIIKKWLKKAYEESLKGAIVVALVMSSTDTLYWHDYIMKANEIRFIKNRLSFSNKLPCMFPSCVVIFKNIKIYPTICRSINIKGELI